MFEGANEGSTLGVVPPRLARPPVVAAEVSQRTQCGERLAVPGAVGRGEPLMGVCECPQGLVDPALTATRGMGGEGGGGGMGGEVRSLGCGGQCYTL